MMFIGVTLVSYLPMPYPCSGIWYSLSAAMWFSTSKHPDGTDGYLLRGNPAVGDVVLAHRAVTVRMDGTEVGIDRIRLFF